MDAEVVDVSRSPYQRFLGVVLVHSGDGQVEIRLPFRVEFLRDDKTDVLHGAVLSGLIDLAGDYAIATRIGMLLPTIDMRVDYLRPARRGDLVAVARVVKLGRRVALADVEVKDESGAIVAIGRAAYAPPAAPGDRP